MRWPLPSPCLALLATTLAAQEQTAALLHLDSRPVLRATLRAGEKFHPCHLLVDLSAPQPLLLHSAAARALQSATVDIDAGGCTWHGIAAAAGEDRFLERLTARHAHDLSEVAVAGVLGPAAFAGRILVLDGPGVRLRLLPALPDPAPAAAGVFAFELRDARAGVRVPALAGDAPAELLLATREPWSFLAPRLWRTPPPPVKAGELDLAARTPFRALEVAGCDGGIGAAALRQMVVTLDVDHARLLLAPVAEPDFPAAEAAFCAARYGAQPIPLLREFLAAHAEGRCAEEAAEALVGLLLAAGRQGTADLAPAAKAWLAAAPADGKGSAARRVLELLPADPALRSLRQDVIELALPHAAGDVDGTASHELRRELGELFREAGDLAQARRHLLAAVFGMPADGAANLGLGRVYEARGDLRRARSRYFLAMLDSERTGEAGYLAFAAVHPRIDPTAPLLPVLEELAEGRVPDLHPIPRAPQEPRAGGRAVLVELFTGAHVPDCVAADVAARAVALYFTPAEVAVICWHLPVPSPGPLVCPVAEERARSLGVRAAPAAVLAGRERIACGGDRDGAPAVFARLRAAVETLGREPAGAAVTGTATRDGDSITLHAEVRGAAGLRLHAVLTERTLVYPGRSGVLFHHCVARARLTPPAGARPDGAVRCTLSAQQTRAGLEATLDRIAPPGGFRIRPTSLGADLQVIVFLEDPSTAAVVQAACLPVQP